MNATERAEFLAESDRRDHESRMREQAFRAGYELAAAQFTVHYERGYTDAQLDRKTIDHGLIRDIRQHMVMWDGLRTDFGNPRPGDYPGQEEEVAA